MKRKHIIIISFFLVPCLVSAQNRVVVPERPKVNEIGLVASFDADALIKEASKSYSMGDLSYAKKLIDSACNHYIDGQLNFYQVRKIPERVRLFASLIYARIGVEASEIDTLWNSKIEIFKESSYSEPEDDVIMSFVHDVYVDGYYEKGNKYYNEKKYSDALESLGTATFLDKYGKRRWRGKMAAAYLKMAMCYAKVGELLETSEGSEYSGYYKSYYKRVWIGAALRNINNYKQCNVVNVDEKYLVSYIFQTIGNGLYNRSVECFEHDFYQSAMIFADSARNYFLAIDNEEWEKKARNLAERSKIKMQTQDANASRIPDDDVSDDVYYNIPEAEGANDSTFVFILFNGEYSCGEDCFCSISNKDVGAFNDYCNKSLGIPQEHIKTVTSVSADTCLYTINKRVKESKGKMNLIFYYLGYAQPLDPINDYFDIEQLLGELSEIRTGYTICLIDDSRSGPCWQALSARIKINDDDDGDNSSNKKGGTVKIKKRNEYIDHSNENLRGNMAVIKLGVTPYRGDPNEGLITYYFLKGLQRMKGEGDVTLGELYDYVYYNMRRVSVRETGVFLSPTIITSPSMEQAWRRIKL